MEETNKKYAYTLRAHHGMCLHFFRGKGYSEAFVENMTHIKEDLKQDLDVKIVNYTEDICCACPNNISGKCTSFTKIKGFDDKVLELCGLKSGDILKFSDFEKLIYEKIFSKNLREKVCGTCRWTSICHENI